MGGTIAALVLLWLPVHMLFHALAAAHVRRTSVTFAVALQCEAALSRGSSDLHRASFTDRLRSGHLSGPLGGGLHETEVDGAEAFVLKGRRFAAPGLADAAAAFFAAEARGVAVVRSLLRSPLLAALGGAAMKRGDLDGSELLARPQPAGVWGRLRRALHSELTWHARAFRHVMRAAKALRDAAAHGHTPRRSRSRLPPGAR